MPSWFPRRSKGNPRPGGAGRRFRVGGDDPGMRKLHQHVRVERSPDLPVKAQEQRGRLRHDTGRKIKPRPEATACRTSSRMSRPVFAHTHTFPPRRGPRLAGERTGKAPCGRPDLGYSNLGYRRCGRRRGSWRRHRRGRDGRSCCGRRSNRRSRRRDHRSGRRRRSRGFGDHLFRRHNGLLDSLFYHLLDGFRRSLFDGFRRGLFGRLRRDLLDQLFRRLLHDLLGFRLFLLGHVFSGLGVLNSQSGEYQSSQLPVKGNRCGTDRFPPGGLPPGNRGGGGDAGFPRGAGPAAGQKRRIEL